MERPFDLITFDFDGVLLHNDYNDRYLEACRALGMTWPAQREAVLARFVHDYFGSGEATRVREAHGERFWEMTHRRFLEVLGVEGKGEELAPALAQAMREAEFIHFYETGVHEMLAQLQEAGYRIAMLTNRDEQVRSFAAEWDLIEPFEFIGTRETVGKPKPEPDLFHHIADWFKVVPERALHVGDNPYADVLGAQAAGWECVLIDPDDLFPDWEVPRLRTIRALPDWLAEQNGAG